MNLKDVLGDVIDVNGSHEWSGCAGYSEADIYHLSEKMSCDVRIVC